MGGFWERSGQYPPLWCFSCILLLRNQKKDVPRGMSAYNKEKYVSYIRNRKPEMTPFLKKTVKKRLCAGMSAYNNISLFFIQGLKTSKSPLSLMNKNNNLHQWHKKSAPQKREPIL